MAEDKEIQKTTPEYPQDKGGGEEGETISLEDIDEIIADADPEFSDQMKQISEDEELKKADLEVLELSEAQVEVEKEEEGEAQSFLDKHPKLKKVIKPFANIIFYIRAKLVSGFDSFTDGIMNSFYWLKNDLPGAAKKALIKSKEFFGKVSELIKLAVKFYKDLPKKTKLGLLLSILFAVLFVVLIKRTIGGSWLPQFGRPLISSLEENAEYVRAIEAKGGLIKLYDAFPQPEEFVLINKVVVNLKRVNSYRNPMAAIEMYFEVDSNETAIEIKDRENQILDAVQRSIEDFTYEEVRSLAGKAKLKANIRYDVNELLNQGRIQKVFFKTIILKP